MINVSASILRALPVCLFLLAWPLQAVALQSEVKTVTARKRTDVPITETELAAIMERDRKLREGRDPNWPGPKRSTDDSTHHFKFLVPPDPDARPDLVQPHVAETVLAPENSQLAPAPGDFRVFNSKVMTDVETNDNTSPRACEPTIAMNGRTTVVTGNWFSSVSGDYTDNYSYTNPATKFPASAGGFCCDQVVTFDRRHDQMVWYLQYRVDTTGTNIARLAISQGMEDQAANSWFYYDLTPGMFGYPAGDWLDFPGMAISDNFLYFTTNVFTFVNVNTSTYTGSVAGRISLDSLGDSNVNITYFTDNNGSLRPARGAGTTMFFANHLDLNTLRVYRWTDGNTLTTENRDVNAWVQAATDNDPNNVNWCGFVDGRVLGAVVVGSRVTFMWSVGQSGGFPLPHIRSAEFDTSDLSLVDQGAIWNSTTSFAYPDAQANDSGGVGVVLAYRPNGSFPNFGGAIADSYGGDLLGPLSVVNFGTGTGSPAGGGRWGDYLTVRRACPWDNTFISAGWIRNATAPGDNTEVRIYWFGREEDTPNTTRTIYVNGAVTNTFQDGTSTNPYDSVRKGYFAASDGDTLVITAGAYDEPAISMVKEITILSVGGDVVFK